MCALSQRNVCAVFRSAEASRRCCADVGVVSCIAYAIQSDAERACLSGKLDFGLPFRSFGGIGDGWVYDAVTGKPLSGANVTILVSPTPYPVLLAPRLLPRLPRHFSCLHPHTHIQPV